jgi:dephospho-CoA kinase
MKAGEKTESAFPGFEVWGLTGGIAAGKSAAARFFVEAGVPVIDADLVARELSQPGGAAYDEIVQHFGTADRGRLREVVFKDADARRDLEAILHPRIQGESLRRMKDVAQKTGRKRILYEAALLVETERYRALDGLLVIDAPESVRRERLIARDGFAPELADQILAAQASDAERRKAATELISNTGTLEDLQAAVVGWIARHLW